MGNPETIRHENQIGLYYLIRNQCPRELIEDVLNTESIQLNYQNDDGDTAMHIAVEGCRTDVIELLIERGARAYLNIENNLFKTPAGIVAENLRVDQSKWESIACLLREGAKIKNESSLNEPMPSTSKAGIKRQGLPLKDSIIETKRFKTGKHPASGIKRSLHGIIFQLKLLMLFAHRALKNNLIPFHLASEFDPAEKFDDIVFMSQNTRVLQAKHKFEGETNRITAQDLLSTLNTAPFGLQKYFISFCKIKTSNSKWFENSEVSDFIIITNADFDLAENRHSKIKEKIKLSEFLQKEHDLEDDKILFIDNINIKKFRLNSTDPNNFKRLMKINLLNSASKTKIQIDNIESIKELLFAMKVMHFENAIKEVKKGRKPLNDSSSIQLIKSEIKNVLQLQEKIYDCSKKITDSDNRWQQFSDLTNLIKGLKQNNKTQNFVEITSLADGTMNDIINNLQISKRKLASYNTAESKEVVTLLTAESELKDIREKIWDSKDFHSMKQKIENKYLEKNVSKTFFRDLMHTDFDEAKQQIEKKLDDIISEISFVRLVLTCNAEFDPLFQEFLDKFHFVTNYPNETDLGEYIDEEFSGIFNLLESDLLTAAYERRMLKFLKFYENGQAKFLTSKDLQIFYSRLNSELSGLMAYGLHKQHIDVLQKFGIRFKLNPKPLEEFINHANEKQVFYFRTTTSRLTAIKVLHTINDSTQYKLLNSYIFTSLKALLTGGDVSFGNEPQEIILNAFKTESSNSLLVIEFQKEADGDKADRIDLKRLCESLSGILAENSSKKLILIAKSGTRFGKLVVEDELEEEIYFRDLDEASQTKVLEKEINFQDRDVQLRELIDETSADTVFDQEILSAFLEDESTVKIGDKKAFASNHYFYDFYIERQFQSVNGTIRDEDDFCKVESLSQKIVIVANESGMGKSTALTSIANKIKTSLKHIWVVRLNLNDFKADKRKSRSLNKINFRENDTDKAIEFVIKMISLHMKKKPLVRFQYNLFKLGLQNTSTEARKPKIVIIFDGFDEVSRSTDETTALIKALKTSRVVQIWISTRVLKKRHLEEELDSLAYNLVPLANENQIDLASNFWKWKLKFKESDSGKQINKFFKDIIEYLNAIELPSEDYAKELGDSISKIKQKFPPIKRSKKKNLLAAIDNLDFSEYIKKFKEYFTAIEGEEDLSFTTNPLHLKMLAEVIYEKKFKLEKNLGLFELYDEFVKIKFKIFYKMKGKAGDCEAMEDTSERDSENVCNIHGSLSVRMFTDDSTYKTLPNLQLFEGTTEENQALDRVGFFKLVDEEQKELDCVHRSYAEYFCSRYLIDNLESEVVQRLAQALVVDENKMLRHFFEKNPKNKELKRKLFPDIHHKT